MTTTIAATSTAILAAFLALYLCPLNADSFVNTSTSRSVDRQTPAPSLLRTTAISTPSSFVGGMLKSRRTLRCVVATILQVGCNVFVRKSSSRTSKFPTGHSSTANYLVQRDLGTSCTNSSQTILLYVFPFNSIVIENPFLIGFC